MNRWLFPLPPFTRQHHTPLGLLLFALLSACSSSDDTSKKRDAAPSSSADADRSDAISSSDAASATVVDPAPEATTAGKHRCETCPDGNADQFTLSLSNARSRSFTGLVTGAKGDGSFYVASDDGQKIFGAIDTDDNGNYNTNVPLFCGKQQVKLVWSNAAGLYAEVYEINSESCVDAEMRLTISWDALGDDWELHLLKDGGKINDEASDCTWTSCFQKSLDWGVSGETSDNPRKDVDNTSAFGPENIYLDKIPAGRYAVMVEHWKPSGSDQSDGVLVINLKGHAPTVLYRQNLAPKHVWTAATIDWPSAIVTPVNTDYDCSESWSGGCTAAIP